MTKQYYPGLEETVCREVLPNGLTVLVVPRPGFRKKLAYFATDFGSVHRCFTLEGKPYEAPQGVAHYLEHKLFDMPWGEVSADFAALGANPNAFTSYDMTAYYFSCTENFDACLKLLLQFVSTPYFTEESVAKEQGIIGQEIDMTADSPDNRIFETLMEGMYRSHKVRETILGTKETIAAITPQVLETCHRAFYTPENMVLCVVGDVVPEDVAAMAREILGDEKRPAAIKEAFPEEEMTCPEETVQRAMEVAMPMFQLGFKCEAPGKGEAAVRQEVIGDLAAEALFGESSALYLAMYEEGLIDSSFGGGFETVDGMGLLTCSGDSETPEKVKEAVLQGLQTLLEKGLEERDFLRMKRSALGRRIRDLDSFDSTCFRLCAYHFTGYDYPQFPVLYQSVQKEEVEAFLRRVVTRERSCLSVIYPLKEA